MRNPPARLRHLVGDVKWCAEIAATNLLRLIQDKVCAANERLFEINGIVHNGDDGEIVAVTHVMVGHGRLVARVPPISLNRTSLDMRRLDCEHVCRPGPGLKPLPGVSSQLRVMRPSV